MVEGNVTVGTSDVAVLEGVVDVDITVEDDAIYTAVDSAVGVDVGVAAGGIELGVEGGVAEDAVVLGGTGVEVLDVERIGAGGGLDFVVGAISTGVVDESGVFSAGVSLT